MGDEPSIIRRLRNGETISRDDLDFHVLLERYRFARNIIPRLNACTDDESRNAVFKELLGYELDPSVIINPPFFTDWGMFITIGRNTFINSNCTLLDQGGIDIGENVMFGPGVSVISSGHPPEPEKRGNAMNRKVTIGDNVWVGANATILPGVTVGCNSVIGACAVVTKDVPPNTVVVGNPARVLKKL